MGCSSSNSRFNQIKDKCNKNLDRLDILKEDIRFFNIKITPNNNERLQEMYKLEEEIIKVHIPELQNELNEMIKDEESGIKEKEYQLNTIKIRLKNAMRNEEIAYQVHKEVNKSIIELKKEIDKINNYN